MSVEGGGCVLRAGGVRCGVAGRVFLKVGGKGWMGVVGTIRVVVEGRRE